MQTRRAAAGMAMSTRGKSAGKASKGEVLAYVSVPKKPQAITKSSGRTKETAHTGNDGPVATAALPRSRQFSEKSAKSTTEQHKASANVGTQLEPPGSQGGSTVIPPTRTSSRSRRRTPAVTVERGTDTRELKRKRQSLDQKIQESEEEQRVLKRQKVALEKQEKALQSMEKKLEVRSEQLDERDASLRLREEEVQNHSMSIAMVLSERLLKYMEDTFNCALCCDIMASPTVLTNTCGHTFCALCIIKWYFSKFHVDCRGWHAPVECPLCRAAMRTPHTNNVPRSLESLPFAPNRLTETAFQQLLEAFPPPPESEHSVTKGKGKKKTADLQHDDPVSDWREGGPARKDWQDRDLRGKDKRHEITRIWQKMIPDEFLAMKESLGT